MDNIIMTDNFDSNKKLTPYKEIVKKEHQTIIMQMKRG